MRLSRLSNTLFIIVLLLVFFSSTVAAKDKWINLHTKNFNIVSNASEGDTRTIANKLEQFRNIFTKIFNVKPEAIPVTVIVFKNDDAFKPFKPGFEGKPANIS